MGLCDWIAICLSYIGFRRGMKAQGIDRSTLPYKHPLALFGAWFAMISFAGVSQSTVGSETQSSHHPLLRLDRV